MTDTPTDREYIERLIDCAPFDTVGAGPIQLCDALRALLAERDALKAKLTTAQGTLNHMGSLVTTMETLETERDALNDALLGCAASLAASISLLKAGGKRAAPSDKMFHMMIADYEASLENARSRLINKETDND